DQPSPAEAVPLTHVRRKLFLTAFVVPPLAGTVIILELLLLMRIWDFVSTGSLLLTAAIPCFFSFLQMTYLIYPSLRLLRSLPLSRTRLSGAVMAGGVGGTLLQALLVGLFTLLGGGQRLPGLPLNFLLLWMSAAAFLPFFMVFLGQWKMWWLCALLLYPSIILVAIFEDSKLVTGLSNLIALPSVPVTAAAGSAIAAFFLLRYALLRPRLDWRYVHEVQELTARGGII
ncbi:MAG: hypothetical protein NTZ09_06175, partial [Candidatus Hydrogenedentes bacterium]|nr:hypothetical protein [Candidatus Hydrogenedentota bacterium]